MKEKALKLAWIVMTECDDYTEEYQEALRFWIEFAPKSVRGDRPIKIDVFYP